MQPYNYSIDLPKPPASTFLQDLMGIQQMKGLQQQREIQAQQAEAQAQQAKFAQELQPLERQKLEAAIAAARANTAQSMASRDVTLEGLRQSKQTFAEQEETKKQENLLREDVMAVVKDPTLATQEKLRDISFRTALFAPKSQEPLQRMFEEFPRAGKVLENTASDVIFAVQSGQPKVAVASVNKQLEAAKNSLQINPDDKEAKATVSLLEGVKSQMDEEKYGEAMVSASIFLKNQNRRKWNAVTGDLKEFGGATKAVAEAEKEQALTKKALGESAAAGVEIKDVFTKDLIAKSTEKVNEYTKKSDLAYGVLEKINTGEIELPKSFVGRWIQKEIKDAYPLFSNEITALKKDFIKIKNSEAAKNLPPGSASNQDVQFAKEGLTSENASPVQFKKAVESMARLYQLDAKYEEAKAAWLSTNGNLGNSRRDISVLGTDVAKGTGFNQWWKKSGSNLVSEQAGAPAPSPTDLTMPPAGAVRRVR